MSNFGVSVISKVPLNTLELGTSFTLSGFLGHKSIKNAEIYVNIVGFDDNENYILQSCRYKRGTDQPDRERI